MLGGVGRVLCGFFALCFCGSCFLALCFISGRLYMRLGAGSSIQRAVAHTELNKKGNRINRTYDYTQRKGTSLQSKFRLPLVNIFVTSEHTNSHVWVMQHPKEVVFPGKSPDVFTTDVDRARMLRGDDQGMTHKTKFRLTKYRVFYRKPYYTCHLCPNPLSLVRLIERETVWILSQCRSQ
ncbi:hypothetical protein V1507DRAFT_460275 [Lipomyces tetrasporus]